MYSPESSIARLSQWLSWLASAALASMMFLVVINVVLRIVYRPILGTYELVGFLSALTISFGLAHTTIKRGHVAVDLFVDRFPERIRSLILTFTACLSVLLFAVLCWQSAKYGMELARSGNLSQTLKIPFYPLVYGLSLASGLTCLALVLETSKHLGKTWKR